MSNSIELTRNIYSDALDWYKSAESKAHILLGILGTFVVFLSGIILTKQDDIKTIISRFDIPVWIGLGLFSLSMAIGLFACFKCLWSRFDKKKLVAGLNEGATYPVSRLYFFGHHALHEPEKLFRSLELIDEKNELRVYSYQIIVLSQNVVKKHRWVNLGFVSACLSIGLMLLTTVLYLIDIERSSHI